MKKNVIFFIDTVYQLISAFNLKQSVFVDDHVTIVMSKDTPSFAQLFAQKKLCECFDTVLYAEWPEVEKRYKIKSPFLLTSRRSEKILSEVYGCTIHRHDICFIANRVPIVFMFLNVLKKKNKNLKMYEFDEGVDSYIHDRPRSPAGRIAKVVDRLFYFAPKGMYDNCYLHAPEFYTADTFSDVLPIPIMLTEQTTCLNKFNEVFDYSPDDNTFPQKYVFLEEADDNISDKPQYRKLVNDMIALVGRENIIVKRHPRNTSTFGIPDVEVLKTIAPWELFVANGALKDKIMISLASSTSYTSVIFSRYQLKSVVLHDVANGLQNASMGSYGLRVNAFGQKISERDKRFVIPKNKQELISALDLDK